jgi:hypothetical protein
MLDAMQVPT